MTLTILNNQIAYFIICRLLLFFNCHSYLLFLFVCLFHIIIISSSSISRLRTVAKIYVQSGYISKNYIAALF